MIKNNMDLLRLRTLSVGDVMTRQVVQVSADQPLGDVANLLTRQGVAAAPVVDADSRCVGVISATDFLRKDQQALGDPASQHMTRKVLSISPNAPLLSAATMMCGNHIHRLIVLQEDRQVVGVLSTIDIVAAVLNAIEEQETNFLKEVKKQPP